MRPLRKPFLFVGGLIVIIGAVVVAQQAWARGAAAPTQQPSPLHPTFPLLDEAGQNVLETGNPVSTMKTCGQCHDTAFIAEHSFHADLGLSDFTAPGQTGSGRAWDMSPGLFGRWNPLAYRYLSAEGDERFDLGTPEWVMVFAERIVGGGAGTTSRDGQPLTSLAPQVGDPDTTALDPETGRLIAWDWQKSGTVEMNCFLCHLSRPNNEARIETIKAGAFRWASTATLLGTGLVERTADGWKWNRAAFTDEGELAREFVTIQDPSNENCAQCHGVVHADVKVPLVLAGCTGETATTGQVFTAQKISDSGMNVASKDEITRAWDIHAERGLKCTDCHFSLNNPAQYQEPAESRPEHLTFDPRRLEIGEYLQKPLHEFARGQSVQYTVAPELKGTMRRCEACHSAVATHDWLPYVERHMAEVACETCHIPRMYAPTIQQYDWTALQPNGGPLSLCRGIETTNISILASASRNIPLSVINLVTGYEPVLLQRQKVEDPLQGGDGQRMLAPYNLITSWYWVYDDAHGNPRPVRLADLQAAWLTDGRYAPEVLQGLDANGNGTLDADELKLDTPEKAAVIAGRLQALGLQNPRIVGEIQPYSLNHDVTRGEWAIKDCQTCHGDSSRLTQPMQLASYVPGGVLPEFVKDANVIANGQLYVENGALFYRPATSEQNLYVFGHDRVPWVDWLGAIMFMGVLAAVAAHGGLRAYAALRAPHPRPQVKRVYMYAVYERFWHWLQTFTIILLLFTGLVIHRPAMFGAIAFSFHGVVVVHNVLAAILVINAALSLFYHLASGEIRQYLPRPYGFFDQAIVQAKYYLGGIFRREPHPFEKTPQKKLNPLQQMTYFGILNVLLPLQVVTGALMWGIQQWPQIANWFGGLPFLAPFHSLIAWTFASFIVAHVYLTTTGHEPLAGIKAMMIGWDEVADPLQGVEDHSAHPASRVEETPDHDHTGTVQTPTPAP